MDLLDSSYLFAALIWGCVGMGYFIYGKRAQAWVPMVGGILMMAVSYLVSSALLMSLICLGLIAAVYYLLREGY